MILLLVLTIATTLKAEYGINNNSQCEMCELTTCCPPNCPETRESESCP
jgi:hypothetical protein